MTCRPAKELVLSKEKPIPYQPPLPPNEAPSGVDAAAGVTPVGLRPPFVTPAAAHSHPDCRGIPILIVAPHSRAYKKNDQAFVEQKNGAVVRRLMGYGRFDGIETARVMGRLYAAARLYVNFFQPSFKLKEKRREGARVIKRYHPPSTPYERALAHPKVTAAVKKRLRDQYRSLDPVALLAEIRATQDELGNRVDRRAGQARGLQPASTSTAPATAATFAKTLGKTTTSGEQRATHRRSAVRHR